MFNSAIKIAFSTESCSKCEAFSCLLAALDGLPFLSQTWAQHNLPWARFPAPDIFMWSSSLGCMHYIPQLNWLCGHYESWIISTELLIAPSQGSDPISSHPRFLPNTSLWSLAGCLSSAYLTNTPVLSTAVSSHTAVSLTFKHCHGEWHKALSGSLLGSCWLASWRSCTGTITLHYAPCFFLPTASSFFYFHPICLIMDSFSRAGSSSVVLVFPHDWCFAPRRCQFFLGAKQLGLIHCINLLSKWLNLL